MPETSKTETSKTPPPPTVWPTLRARDAHALIRGYVEVFGFVATAVYGEGDRVDHAQLDWPEGGGLMLGSAKPEAEWNAQPGTGATYVVTDRIEEVWQRVQGAPGFTVTRPLTAPDYGGQEFSVADPEGNLWSFGTYRGEPRD